MELMCSIPNPSAIRNGGLLGWTPLRIPRDKREFGYYVLPILDGDALIGRVDARMDRKARKLVVDGIFAEKGAPTDAGSRIATSLADLATWQGATDVLVSQRGSPHVDQEHAMNPHRRPQRGGLLPRVDLGSRDLRSPYESSGRRATPPASFPQRS
jgi:hypothetical protein